MKMFILKKIWTHVLVALAVCWWMHGWGLPQKQAQNTVQPVSSGQSQLLSATVDRQHLLVRIRDLRVGETGYINDLALGVDAHRRPCIRSDVQTAPTQYWGVTDERGVRHEDVFRVVRTSRGYEVGLKPLGDGALLQGSVTEEEIKNKEWLPAVPIQ